MSTRRVRGIVVAVVLCTAVAGCASVASGTVDAVRAPKPASAVSANAVGCASVNQATVVTIRRTVHLAEPIRAGGQTVTQRKPALVRALFGDFCKVIAHRFTSVRVVHCPLAFGLGYDGTFYAGHRKLATFVYGASGCQTLSLTAAGKTIHSLVMGSAASAAPHLERDMAAVLGQPVSLVYGMPQQVNPGGPNKPATSSQ